MDGSSGDVLGSTASGAASGAAMGGIPGAIIGGGIGLIGGLMGNSASAKEADANRTFQWNVMRTRHQVEMRDLVEGGLNPILTATGGSGASPGGGAQATQENPLKNVVSDAATGMQLQAQLENLKADTANKIATNKNIQADTANKTAQTPGFGIQQGLWSQQHATEISRTEYMTNLAANIGKDTLLKMEQAYNLQSDRLQTIAQTEGISLENARKKILLEILQADEPGLLDAAKLNSSSAADAKRRVDMFLDSAGKAVDALPGKIKIGGGSKEPPIPAYKLEPAQTPGIGGVQKKPYYAR